MLRCENNQAGAGACPVDGIDRDTNAAANIGTCGVRALLGLPRPPHLKRPERAVSATRSSFSFSLTFLYVLSSLLEREREVSRFPAGRQYKSNSVLNTGLSSNSLLLKNCISADHLREHFDKIGFELIFINTYIRVHYDFWENGGERRDMRKIGEHRDAEPSGARRRRQLHRRGRAIRVGGVGDTEPS